MPATILTVTPSGQVAGKELLVPSGPEGVCYDHVSAQVLVKGIKQWAAYDEKVGGKTQRTVFKIT